MEIGQSNEGSLEMNHGSNFKIAAELAVGIVQSCDEYTCGCAGNRLLLLYVQPCF